MNIQTREQTSTAPVLSETKEQTSTSTGQTAPVVSQTKEQTSTGTAQTAPVVYRAKEQTCGGEEQVTHVVNGDQTGEQNSAVKTKLIAKTTIQEKRCKNAMKKMFRKFLLIRRKYKSESK